VRRDFRVVACEVWKPAYLHGATRRERWVPWNVFSCVQQIAWTRVLAWRVVLLPALLLLAVLPLTACGRDSAGGDTSSTSSSTLATVTATSPSAPLDAARPLLAIRDAGSWRAEGVDDIEVWICHVPADSTVALYFGLPLRLPLTASGVVAILNTRVTPYFATISHGQYQPQFRAGGEATLAIDQGPEICVDQAIVGADDTTDAVLVVADAEHRPEQPGGFGSGGVPCPAEPPCSVLDSRRSAYIGASDFHPDWADQPPMDLVEHELGHTLGWTHSGFVSGAAQPYQSAIDLMSNSAAPRDVDAARRDGPDTLAINRLFAGWLPESDVWVAPAAGGTVQLQPSTGATGTRLALIALADGNYLTVEVLSADGFNAHLPTGGVTVHRVLLAEGAVQTIVPLVGTAPFIDLLQPGEFVDSDGWRIAVLVGGVSVTPIS